MALRLQCLDDDGTFASKGLYFVDEYGTACNITQLDFGSFTWEDLRGILRQLTEAGKKAHDVKPFARAHRGLETPLPRDKRGDFGQLFLSRYGNSKVFDDHRWGIFNKLSLRGYLRLISCYNIKELSSIEDPEHLIGRCERITRGTEIDNEQLGEALKLSGLCNRQFLDEYEAYHREIELSVSAGTPVVKRRRRSNATARKETSVIGIDPHRHLVNSPISTPANVPGSWGPCYKMHVSMLTSIRSLHVSTDGKNVLTETSRPIT
jgi:hypothetical protein